MLLVDAKLELRVGCHYIFNCLHMNYAGNIAGICACFMLRYAYNCSSWHIRLRPKTLHGTTSECKLVVLHTYLGCGQS